MDDKQVEDDWDTIRVIERRWSKHMDAQDSGNAWENADDEWKRAQVVVTKLRAALDILMSYERGERLPFED